MQLGYWHRIVVYGSLSVVAFSGLLWFALHDFVSADPDSLKRLLLIVHGVSAFAVLIVFGSMFPLHVRAGWLNRRNLATGTVTVAVMATLSLTALVLYYGGEDSRFWARWFHIGFGLLVVAVVPLHVVLGHRTRRSVLNGIKNSPESLAMPPVSLLCNDQMGAPSMCRRPIDTNQPAN